MREVGTACLLFNGHCCVVVVTGTVVSSFVPCDRFGRALLCRRCNGHCCVVVVTGTVASSL